LELIAASWPAAEQARMLLDGLKEEYGFSGEHAAPGKDAVPPSAYSIHSLVTSSHYLQQPLPRQDEGNPAFKIGSHNTR
jgi:hypothetical protein